MGLLDYYDPEVVSAMGEYGVSPQAKNQAKNNALMNAGFAMLASNGLGATRNQSLGRALGAGGMAGMHTYNSSIEDAQQQQARQMQLAGSLEKMMQQRRQQQAMQAALANEPEDVRQAVQAGVPFQEIWKQRNESYNLSPGEKRFSGGQVVADGGPKIPEGFIVGPDGQLAVDPAYDAFKTKLAERGASRNSSVVHLPPMESEEQKALGKDLAEQYSTIQKGGLTASGSLNNINRMESLLKGVETGKLTPATTEIAAVADSLGIKIDPKLDQKQAARALSNELALRAKNQGGENLMPGAMSDPDRRFLESMVPSLANTPGGNQLILETMRRKAKRDIEVSKLAREYRQKNKTLNGFSEELSAWSEKNPLFDDLAKSVPQPVSGPPAGAVRLKRN